MTLRTRAAIFAACLLSAVAWAPRAGADAEVSDTLERLDVQLATTPNDPSLWQRRAALERSRGNLERATADLARAGEAGLPAAALERDGALLLLDANRTADAERALRHARTRAPRDVTILLPHARTLVTLGRWREGADTYAEIVRLAPNANPDVHLERARALEAGGPATAREAISSLDRAIARLGPVPALEQAALEIELRAGRTDAALARLDRMAAATPRPLQALLRRAEILERAGRQAEAAAAYGAALAALDDLPVQRRATPAAAELEQHARAGIARVADGAPGDGR